ncbi:YkgJ family cysteine cluster protein [Treponema sp. OMZ 840]|uniref:YkgJ family cysteine cluster protein n=1 Tax=Treponema sp. OMZ 840 TaxID=244313 RepID=UPI003D949E8B
MADTFYSQGLHFSCTRCSHCCRAEPGFVYLSQSDLTNLCKWFNLKAAEFIRLYCRFVYNAEGKKVLSLREKPGYDCILWNNGCTAYGARPIQCSTYPFWSFILQNRHTWESEAAACPGINRGKLYSAEEIEHLHEKYEKNNPLTYTEINRILNTDGTEI